VKQTAFTVTIRHYQDLVMSQQAIFTGTVAREFNPYPANVENMMTSNNASKWQMGFNSAFKGLND
jgi:hypothetical protein